nr:fibronectin type III domain-containing protein 5 isoform X3 [Misgurnus anguillicaudatus]
MLGITGSFAALLFLLLGFISVSSVDADGHQKCFVQSREREAERRDDEFEGDSLSAPLNVTIKALEGNSAIVTWDILEGEPVIGFAITQQKKDVRMLRFIQEVNTTTRSCALWDLEEDTEYIVHVQSISMSGSSPPSEPVLFRTPKESEKLASKSPDEVTMEEVGQSSQLRAGELIIIVVVLVMWAGVIALFCRQYDIIKDNEPNNNKDKAKNSSECSTPEHPSGGLLRSKV